MNIQDISSFRVSVNGEKYFDLPRTGINVQLSDSIYDLCPTMTITVPDSSGLLIGARAGGYGVRYDFELASYDSVTISLPMRADHFELASLSEGTSALSGTVRLGLKHSFAFQPSEMRAFKNSSPDSILRTLMMEFGSENLTSYNDLDSASVLDMETIYNPNLTPIRFIEEILLPLSSATTSMINNPFYAFMDIQNRFRFKNLKSILEQPITRTLVFSTQLSMAKSEMFGAEAVKAVSIIPFSQKYSRIFDVIDTETDRIENGKWSSVDTSFKKITSGYQMGFYDRKKSLSQYMSETHFQTSDEMMRLQAGINLKNRKAYMIDKIMVSTLLDLDLCAGRKVKIQSYYGNSSEPMTSYSGEYVIESSIHKWDSNVNSGITELVLGTPDPYITNTLISAKAYEG